METAAFPATCLCLEFRQPLPVHTKLLPSWVSGLSTSCLPLPCHSPPPPPPARHYPHQFSRVIPEESRLQKSAGQAWEGGGKGMREQVSIRISKTACSAMNGSLISYLLLQFTLQTKTSYTWVRRLICVAGGHKQTDAQKQTQSDMVTFTLIDIWQLFAEVEVNRGGKYPPLFTFTSANNCFCIYTTQVNGNSQIVAFLLMKWGLRVIFFVRMLSGGE